MQPAAGGSWELMAVRYRPMRLLGDYSHSSVRWCAVRDKAVTTTLRVSYLVLVEAATMGPSTEDHKSYDDGDLKSTEAMATGT
eukprot:1144495-Rhodomonas_salina.1